MKKLILNGFLGLSLLFSACNPYEDIHDQLEIDVKLQTENDAIPEALSLDSTYATLEIAEVELAEYMTVTYPRANKHTEGKITEIEYNLGVVVAEPDVIVADQYVVNHDDYESVGSGEHDNFAYYDNKAGEFPVGTPVDNILDAKIDFILKANRPDAVEGDRVEVEYEYYDNGTSTKKVVYAFKSGTWVIHSDPNVEVYKLTDDDYQSMGEPGGHNNFSSSVPPENYLPQFISSRYPFGQVGEAVNIIYYYFLGKIDGEYKSEYRANEYTFNGSEWIQTAPLNTTVRYKSKFKYTDGIWKVSKATPITMTHDDYELVDSGKYDNFAYYDNEAGEFPEGTTVDNILVAKIQTILVTNYVDLNVEETEVIVSFQYYDNGTNTEKIAFILTDGIWVVTKSSITLDYE